MNSLNYLFLALIFAFSCTNNTKPLQENPTLEKNKTAAPMDKRFLNLRFSSYSTVKSSGSETETFTLRGSDLIHELVIVGGSGIGNKNEKKEKALSLTALEKIEAYLKEHFSTAAAKETPDTDPTEVMEIRISGKWGALSFDHQLTGSKSVESSVLYKKMAGLAALLRQAISE